MMPAAFDPYLTQRRYQWRNRLARWRQARGETAFHAAIWLALAVLLGMGVSSLSGRRDLADGLLALVRSAPSAWLMAWGGLIAMQLRLCLLDWQNRDDSGWLAVQPVASRMRARERMRVVLRCVFPHAFGGVVLCGFLRLPWVAWGWLVLMLVIASVAGVVWARRNHAQATHVIRPRSGHVHARGAEGRGCLWRWQIREALTGIGPRSLRHGLWMLLLIPVGASAIAAAVALMTGLMLAAYFAAWRRCLGVLVQAERWLGAQPIRSRFWLSGLILPMVLAALGASATGFALAALGAAHVAVWIGLALFALAMLQALCALALRRTPSRIALAFALHLAVLGAAWQAFAPLIAPLWLAMCVHLLYRGLRP